MFDAPAPTTESTLEICECACSDQACPRTARLVLVWPDRPTLMNAAMGMHHRVRSKTTTEWRELFRQLAEGSPRFAWCTVTVDHEHAKAGRNTPDVAATAYTVKAAIDGVVNAGVLTDDDPTHLRSIRFNAPQHTGRDAIIITIDGPLEP